ncbi:hypothetical protein [Niameybacter massiliensis]|uniref:hypothetical protein n=1 Tax=Niameybacter massiliensis TaxID=1658108 RepID=UPI0006B65659|nr:hypothetical protein [Niameybacter massiliensis]
MTLAQNVLIPLGSVTVVNVQEEEATVVVDLSVVWQSIAKYMWIYVTGILELPTIQKKSQGNSIQTITTIGIANRFEVAQIIKQKVTLTTLYSGLIEIDSTRSPQAQVQLIVYNIKQL